jgi:UDP-2,3-diacylglucosamine pyrophosphatase LpxH
MFSDPISLYIRSVGENITDVNQEAVFAVLDASGVRRLIHGHTHRPHVHRIDHQGTLAERIVLGDGMSMAACYARARVSCSHRAIHLLSLCRVPLHATLDT